METPPDPIATKTIVLTGGPGGGKTTAADLYRREFGDHVAIVPEAATMLFGGGFPRVTEAEARVAAQVAIYHVQLQLERAQAARFPSRVLLCDRGTVDGAAYWPERQEEDFYQHLGTTLEDELRRYDAVLFFESAAVGRISIEGGNPVRTEGLDEALAIDRSLRELWSHHPRFVLVPHQRSFMDKITSGLLALRALLDALGREL
ncbi:MAG: AAA family ATPase [Nannocystaceae bacterium]